MVRRSMMRLGRVRCSMIQVNIVWRFARCIARQLTIYLIIRRVWCIPGQRFHSVCGLLVLAEAVRITIVFISRIVDKTSPRYFKSCTQVD